LGYARVDEPESPRPLTIIPVQIETIENGQVVIDLETLDIVDEFQRFVRPLFNPALTDFCKKLTSIQQADVDGGDADPGYRTREADP